MKRKIGILFLFIIFCISSAAAFASFENPPVVDEAGILDSTELLQLTAQLDEIREKYNFDIAVYIEDFMSAATAQDAADDIFDYNLYGGGAGKDGIILYLCMNERKYHFSTHGSGERFFNENGLIYLESKVVPYLRDGEYAEGFAAYAETCDELLEMARNGNPYNVRQREAKDPEFVLIVLVAALLLPILLAFVMMKAKLAKMNTARQQKFAERYIKSDSFRLDSARDIFLYSVVNKTERAQSDSGSHRSSSGESHGGRGGSF